MPFSDLFMTTANLTCQYGENIDKQIMETDNPHWDSCQVPEQFRLMSDNTQKCTTLQGTTLWMNFAGRK